MSEALSPVCADHGHGSDLPDEDLRNHVLNQAIKTVEAELRKHGYPDPDRGLEILHVALEDAVALDHADDPRPLEN